MITDRIITAESGGNPFARNPRSSATGPGQFINSTWLNLVSKYRPDLAAGKSSEEILALRTDPVLSKAMVDAYSSENGKFLSGAGFEVNPGNTYLAHFAGPQGAVNVLQADPTAPAGTILGDAVVKANPFLANMSAGDLIAWSGKKMGGPAPVGSPTVTPPPAVNAGMSQFEPPGAPLSLAPPQQAKPTITGLLGGVGGAVPRMPAGLLGNGALEAMKDETNIFSLLPRRRQLAMRR